MSPAVHPLGWEAGARTWCYFCQCEVSKHEVRQDCTVANAALLRHLTSNDHTQKMHAFFWDNLIPVKRKVDFFVSFADFERFVEKAEHAVENYLRKEKDKISEEAGKILAAERLSQAVRWMGIQQQLVKSSCVRTFTADTKIIKAQANMKMNFEDSSDAGPVGKKTLSAFGPGLTCIMQPEAKEDWPGNIYTGATPPWLMQEDTEGSREIGPTADSFKKHLSDMQKQRLPACRVGATFSHKVDVSAQWLPAFGRVWNSGRRLNSQHQFLKEKSTGNSSQIPVFTSATSVNPSTSQFYRDGGQQGKELQVGAQSKQDAVTCSVETSADHRSIQPEIHSVKSASTESATTESATTESATTESISLHSVFRYVSGQQKNENQQPPSPGPCCSDTGSHTLAAGTRDPTSLFRLHKQHTTADLGASTRKRESGHLLDCVPYKRQRGVHTTMPVLAAGLIPITTQLLSRPAKKRKTL